MPKISRVVIVGGGTAGWMTAAALSKSIPSLDITLVESDSIGTIGVGEATIPTLQFFNGLIGISPAQFIKCTSGSFKLGINFENWRNVGEDYFHAFGTTGKAFWAAGFHDFWTRGQKQGIGQDFGHYNFEAQAAKAYKFAISPQGLNYAYHLDAGKYASLLREKSEANGVRRIEGKINRVSQCPDSGHIVAVSLEDGMAVEGDLFIDCSGFRSLLLGDKLAVPFVDFSEWLFNDSAIAIQTEKSGQTAPYTRSIANKAGWQWRIPLQHRMGNGIVYASEYLSDDEATAILLNSVDGKPLTTPRPIRFKTGYRQQLWSKNVVAIGLAGGFIEPLESTAIHLIQQGILRLIKLFPYDVINQKDRDEYNLSAQIDYEQIRDFIVLHYKQTNRSDSPYWERCKAMSIPPSLADRMALFKETGRFIQRSEELFVDSWLQVMIGQGLIPQQYHRIVDEMSDDQLAQYLGKIQADITQRVSKLPNHDDFISGLIKGL